MFGVHNHPSGNLTPISYDNKVTSQLFEAVRLLDIGTLVCIVLARAFLCEYEGTEEGVLANNFEIYGIHSGGRYGTLYPRPSDT